MIFGFQNPSPIEDDLALVEIWHRLGVRFMQLSYNNQSLLATGCYEAEDPGITRMGREVIREMNRVGLVIDMSHSAERSTLEAIELSSRPIAITHANPASWHPVARNKSDTVLRALGQSGGMLGFSLYPLHLKGGSGCSLRSFCEMVARTAEIDGHGEYRDRFGPVSGSAGFGCRMDACRPLDARLARSFGIARGCGVSAAAGMVSQQHAIWQHRRRTGGSGLRRRRRSTGSWAATGSSFFERSFEPSEAERREREMPAKRATSSSASMMATRPQSVLARTGGRTPPDKNGAAVSTCGRRKP